MISAGITKVKVHRGAIDRAAQKGLSRKQVKDIAWKRASQISERCNSRLTEEFNAHPVTKEIDGGPGASNLSGSINGSVGNLFTFIGFTDGSSPAEIVRQFIASKRRVYRTSKFVKTSTKGGQYSFRVDAPTLEKIYQITPMPWESGRSWVRGVSSGISGIGHYLYKKGIAGSRSGAAVQIKGSLSASFSRQPYMNQLLNKYRSNLVTGELGK